MQMGFGGSFIPFYNPLAANNMLPNVTTSPVASNSCLTLNNGLSDSRKRPRGSGSPVSFLGDDVSAFVHNELLDIDHLINQHAEKVRMELAERRRRFLNELMVAVENNTSKRLKGKQEELERMAKLNWALQESIRSLSVEGQQWRELAQSNEATADLLRSKLEHALAAQVKEEHDCVDAAATAEDAGSCCYEEEGEMAKRRRRSCVSCRDGEPAVVVLPCRHLCLCVACETVAHACPVCNCFKAGTLFVNML